MDVDAVLSPVESRGALLSCSDPIYNYEEAGDLMCSQAQQQRAANQCWAQLLVMHVPERWRPSRSGSWVAISEDAAFLRD